MAEIAHYKEMHPLAFRITHWVNLVAMILLILSGIEIHYPVLGGVMGLARGLHIFCGIVLVVNCIARIVLAFVIKSSPMGGTRETVTDFWNWLPQKYNRHQLGAWIKYYLFIKKDHPLSAKLGVPQKLSYLLIGILILFMAFLFFGLRIAIRCEDRFGSLLAGGITCMIGVQCVLNVAVVTGLMPTTGLPLPFFSAGGTSISIVMCAVAVLMNISASTRRE